MTRYRSVAAPLTPEEDVWGTLKAPYLVGAEFPPGHEVRRVWRSTFPGNMPEIKVYEPRDFFREGFLGDLTYRHVYTDDMLPPPVVDERLAGHLLQRMSYKLLCRDAYARGLMKVWVGDDQWRPYSGQDAFRYVTACESLAQFTIYVTSIHTYTDMARQLGATLEEYESADRVATSLAKR